MTILDQENLTSSITSAMIQEARVLAENENTSIFAGLQSITGLSAEAVMQHISNLFSYPLLSMQELQSFSPAFDEIGFTESFQRNIVLFKNEDHYILVLGSVFDSVAEEWALRYCSSVSIKPKVMLAQPEDLQAYFSMQEQQLRAMDGFENVTSDSDDEEVAAVITLSSISDDSSQVIKLVNSTIYDALKLQASDIHLETDAGSLHVLYRIDGVLVPITQVQDQDIAEQVISRIKVMAELDIAERRTPQDGRFRVRVTGREIDFRVSVMPNIFGEDAVLRLLDRQSLSEQAKTLKLDDLGLDVPSMTSIRKLASKPHGMLLVTGPTGSGKTTTLYAAITEIHTGRDKIITIEDPVEYRLPRVLQIPVNEKKGLTFALGLRSILRHDPDKIMVGEIRDDETAQIAVQAALTGHLVFTTVHANNVFDVVGRFLHMGVDAYSFSAALNGIVAQRLLRINCNHCSVDIAPDQDQLELAGLTKTQTSAWKFKAGQGCGHCRGTGYKGREAVAEVLTLDDTLRELIATGATISALKAHAKKLGFKSLNETILLWLSKGQTTLEEVLRVAG